MRNPIYDNRTPETQVKAWLDSHLHAHAHLRVASAYFTVGAFTILQKKLEGISEMRFLFGEPKSVLALDPSRPRAAWEFKDGTLKLHGQITQNTDALACAAWIRQKVSIRRVREGRLSHGKLYHIAYPRTAQAIWGPIEPKDAALVGSSNFTVYGLGASARGGNLELNLEAYDDRDREALAAWFDDLWKDETLTEDAQEEVLGFLERMARDNAPEFVYYKTLLHLFEDRLAQGADMEAPGEARWRDSQVWQKLYTFQKHGARGALHKLERFGGCILADSVGLGKTFEALAVIKYFEAVKRERVLVLAPKKLRQNWEIYQSSSGSRLNPFARDGFGFALKNHTDLGLEKWSSFDWENYGLIVIDESHNFRNNTRGKDGRKSRYEWLMEEVLKRGLKTRVLLLSATPVNTDLKDLRNQIYLLSEGNDAAFADELGVASVGGVLKTAQAEFNSWADGEKNGAQNGNRPGLKHDVKALLERLPSGFFTLLDGLTIARSREHIRRFYAKDIAAIGAFPERLKPVALSPDIDLQGLFPSYDALHADISKYQLALFKPSAFLKEEFKALYEEAGNFSQELREGFLVGMMRVNFLKRLESSVQSFEISMQRTMDKIGDLEQRIANFKSFAAQNPQFGVGGMFNEELDEDPELREAFEVTEVGYKLEHLKLDDWSRALKQDKQQLNRLYLAARDVDAARDAKMHALKDLIANRAAEPPLDKNGKPNRKVLVFTAFADTAKYLYEHLSAWAKAEHGIECGLVVGSGPNMATWGGSEFGEILTHFSPVSKRRADIPSLAQDSELDLLIATDCISEGQNLQDCGLVVNYDIHWNPVRLIQRFGRVDRLGSLHTHIQMVNFWPTDDLNRYINLKNRVEARMALVDVAGTNQDNVLQSGGPPSKSAQNLIEHDLSFRDEQLLSLRDKTPDMEELSGGVSLSEFTLDDFVADLLAFLEARRGDLEAAPEGIFAVAPMSAKVPGAPGGIVFCLRRRGGQGLKRKAGQSRFAPYFLVYARDDGEIQYSFTDDKRLLSALRGVCVGRAEPIDKLCRAFESENAGMEAPFALLEKVTAHIAQLSKSGAARGLARGGLLASQAALPSEDDNWDRVWDLVTWIVIRPDLE